MCTATVRPLYTFASLKAKQRHIRKTFPENLGLRVHRGLSWLDRAEKEVEAGDYDAAFINLMMDHPESPWGAAHYPVADP